MEFPLVGLAEVNSSNAAAAAAGTEQESLYSRKPVVAGLYVGVLGVAAFVGTLGNLAVIATVTVKHIRSRGRTNNDVGRAFIANLASSDLIVTSVINPLAIAGPCIVPTAPTTYIRPTISPGGKQNFSIEFMLCFIAIRFRKNRTM